ncbi:hypothetical protein E1295_22245 [Nonomuraea mesophila]|uniref:WD40 repeat domain-containing protein n=1 Tax=Nonomuraea mesophila TaxID=2530382 RepID=A0A4R5FDM9_9ACTN|nr:hypothetical protein [Nonomuraea mesophila]TDE47863.1 hypothetical protein E1295_22245 [Nonomuraea mesophila]
MTKDLEDDLHRVIMCGAEGAPQAPAGFPAQIVGRSRRRRERRHAVAAALAVVVVAGGVGWAVRGQGDNAPVVLNPVATPSASAATTRAADPRPIDQVWPQAVWKIPAKLPGVKKYQPRVFIDDHTVLLETWESFEKADAIYAYDLTTGRHRKIADIRTPEGVYASNYAAGQDRIVWQTITGIRTTFWSVPIAGGEPEPIPTDAPVEGRGDTTVVVGDRLAFSVMEGGVFTLPLTGGAVTPVADAERHHILRWPWVGTPGRYTPNNEPSFEEIRNVETGETSKALVRPGDQDVRCGVTTCVGIAADHQPFYRLRDGSHERQLQQSAATGVAYDRFMTVRTRDQRARRQLLLDLATGKSGDLGLRETPDGKSYPTVEPGIYRNNLVAYPLGDDYVIIDLTRIT